MIFSERFLAYPVLFMTRLNSVYVRNIQSRHLGLHYAVLDLSQRLEDENVDVYFEDVAFEQLYLFMPECGMLLKIVAINLSSGEM